MRENMGSEQAAQIRSAFSFGDADQLQQVTVPRDFGASKFESNARPFDTPQWLNMCQAIFQQPLSQQQLLAWDKEAQAKITTDVRDALAAYRVGDGLAAPIEAHVATGHR